VIEAELNMKRKLDDRHVHPAKAPRAHEALLALKKNSKEPLTQYIRLKWLNNEINYSVHSIEIPPNIPKHIIACYPADILANLRMVSFTYINKVRDVDHPIHGQFMTAVPKIARSSSEITLERGKEKLLEAVMLGRETVSGNFEDEDASSAHTVPGIPREKLHHPVDDIICELWEFSYADNTGYLSKMIRDATEKSREITEEPPSDNVNNGN